MKKQTGILGACCGLAGLASAHMEMKNPPPLRSRFNQFTTEVDYSMTSPLNADGADFPCKGYNSLMGTPQGQSVINYLPSQNYAFTITGSTPHNGGSCQASLSFDGGKTWTVSHSYIGNCPAAGGDTHYDFIVPKDAPLGEALFGWSWFNKVGNREMYMNCAVVTIGGGEERAEIDARSPGDSFASRPAIFVANVGNGCGTHETKDLEFPNPGPDVTRNTPKELSLARPCGVFIAFPNGKPNTRPSESNPIKNGADNKDEGKSHNVGFMEIGSTCDREGEWNCIDGGAAYQRCASGIWSDRMAPYTGTTCRLGRSDTLVFNRSKSPTENYEVATEEARE